MTSAEARRSVGARTSFPETIRSFARQLMREFPKLYARDHTKFRKRAATILRKSIPGSTPGPKPIAQVTRGIELRDQGKSWTEIYATLHIPHSAQSLLRDRVRSRRRTPSPSSRYSRHTRL